MTRPTDRQYEMLTRLRSNIDKAQTEADRIARVLQPHIEALVAEGGDPDAPRMADFENSEDNYSLPSYNASIQNAQDKVSLRKREYDEYLAKLRGKGVEI